LFEESTVVVFIMRKVNKNNGIIDTATVGGRIKKLRTDAGLTQEQLAEKLHLEGKSAISNYENNSRGVSAEMLTQLSVLFHVSADYILNGDTSDNLDPIVNEAIEILNHLKTDKAKQSALAMLRQIQILEG
jgi:transcriptional regulator with XRE-family HTH domain